MRRLGWVLFALTCTFCILQTAFLIDSGVPLMSYEVFIGEAFPLATLGSIGGAAVGALIVSRYPRNRIGWLFCLGQLGNAIGSAASASIFSAQHGGSASDAAGVKLAGEIFNAGYTMAFLSLIFLLAPDGHLPSRRWRFAPAVPIGAFALQAGIYVALSGSHIDADAQPGLVLTIIAGAVLAAAALGLSVALGAVALWRRLRAATGEQRQQLRWIAASAAALTVTFVLAIISQAIFAPAPWMAVVPWYLSYIFVSVAVGVSILKYRLYDIDVILSRAVVLAILAVFVTVGYVGVVVAIGAVLSAVGAPGTALYWPSLVATALVATAFQPLRRYVLQLADQLVYGNRAMPYEALAALSRRLADNPSAETLPFRVAEATGRAVGAHRTLVRLGPTDGAVAPVASWPADPPPDAPTASDHTATFPVRDMGEQIGSIEVAMAPGRTLRTFERRFLTDVAAQAGVAFRNALLEAELAARVDETRSRSAELAASRRRLVGVEDEARERLAAAIRRGVVPHLEVVESAIRSGRESDLDRLTAETERALEELRNVCRGVFPALLERRGLVPALAAQLDLTHPLARLDVAPSADRRLTRAADAAGYLFCIEVAPTDRPSVIGLRVDDGQLLVTITGDGLDAQHADWQHARDRVAALDGDVLLHPTTLLPNSEAAQQFRVRARIPLVDHSTREAVMADQSSSSRSGPNDDLGT